MKSNYNDVIDLLLTIIEEEEVRKSILICGSIVPYIILGEESKEFHNDLYVYVKRNKIDLVRKELIKLSKKYELDIVSDTKKLGKYEFGFKIKYEDTIIGFFPYTLINNKLTVKTYRVNTDEKKIEYKTKVLEGINKEDIIRSTMLSDKAIRIISPEYLLVDLEQKGELHNKTYIKRLTNISDNSKISKLRNSYSNIKVELESRNMVEKTPFLNILIVILFVILLIVGILCI
jgi:hypothetical protein